MELTLQLLRVLRAVAIVDAIGSAADALGCTRAPLTRRSAGDRSLYRRGSADCG